MVDIEYSMDFYKSVKTSIGTVMKNQEMLSFVLAHLKTNKMCKHAVKKLPFLTLKSVLDCYKNQELCKKAVDIYPHALELVTECYKTQKICDKAVDTHLSTIKYISECYKSQEICNKAVHRNFLYLILFLINIKLKKYEICFLLYSLL